MRKSILISVIQFTLAGEERKATKLPDIFLLVILFLKTAFKEPAL